jgi:hypothetical protein
VAYSPASGYPPARTGAPASVRVVAAAHYATALTCLGAAGLAVFLAAGDGSALDGVSLPPRVRENVTAIGVGSALALVLVGFFAWLVGRKLRRGRRWARALVLGLSVPSIALTLWAGFQGQAQHVFAGLVLPVVYVTLLSTAPARRYFHRPAPPAAPAQPYPAGQPYPAAQPYPAGQPYPRTRQFPQSRRPVGRPGR